MTKVIFSSTNVDEEARENYDELREQLALTTSENGSEYETESEWDKRKSEIVQRRSRKAREGKTRNPPKRAKNKEQAEKKDLATVMQNRK